MKTFKDEDFLFDSFWFVASMIYFLSSLIEELKSATTCNYINLFREASDSMIRTSKLIDLFIGKWENDDCKICKTLSSIRQYYSFYGVTLNNSSPSKYHNDVKNIVDSLNTEKLVLEVRLNSIITFLKNSGFNIN